MKFKSVSLTASLLLIAFCLVPVFVTAQVSGTVLASAELARIVPPGFYFQGLSGPTQIRNSAAARFGSNRYVISGLVDTSGYSADIRATYEGFFITDSLITINGSELGIGAYGFGFSNDGKMQVMDLAGNVILSVSTSKDSDLKRPRPLMMTKTADGIRLYSGKDFVTITAK